MADAKPPTTLKIFIQSYGSREQLLDLFDRLNALGFLERSQDIALNVGYYVEEEGKAARDAAEALLRDHPAVMKTKSYTDWGTKRKISETFPSADEGDEEEEDDETPLERYAREQEEGSATRGSLVGRVFDDVAAQVNAGALDRDGYTVRADVRRGGR